MTLFEREWEEHDIRDLVSIIAGQERGTKVQHIEMAAKGKYPSEKILMIGDAPGDRKAAKANGAYSTPSILIGRSPGNDSSMKPSTGSSGQYAGDYEKELEDAFEACFRIAALELNKTPKAHTR